MRFSPSLPLFVLFAALAFPNSVSSNPLYHAFSTHYRTNIFAYGVVAGDFDADGRLDYFLDSPNQLGRGHGDGRFDPVQALGGSIAGPASVADLNGDGVDDEAIAGLNGISIRYGSPGLGLGPETVLDGGVALDLFVALADVNGDGRPDLVTGNGANLWVHLATGPTSYGPGLSSPIGGADGVGRLAVGDVDEDGKPDVLIQTGAYAVVWSKGHGDGTFDPAVSLGLPAAGSGVFLADVNGDHHLDAIGDHQWCAGNGLGGFGPPVDVGPIDILAVGDLTGDGAPDIVGGSGANDSIINGSSLDVYVNDGAGHFTHTWSQSLLETDVASLGDFNGDGLKDIIVYQAVFGNVSVHLSNGDGTFGREAHYLTGNRPSGIVLADITRDGRLDVITSDRADGTLSVLPGLPSGKFDLPIHYAVGSGPNGLATGDLNGDGLPDIVTADGGSNTVTVLLGQPGGGLASAGATGAGSVPSAVALVDMNRDGKLDAIVLDQGSSLCTILYGNGLGGFSSSSSTATSPSPDALSVDDLDGDLWPDVAIITGTQSHNGNLDVLLNNKSGGLLPKVSYLEGISNRAVGIADVTGDGVPDVIDVDRNFVRVMRGTGGGALSALPGFRVSQSRALTIADGDLDGRPDLFIAADWANCAWFVKGTGGGNFAEGEGYGTGRGPNGIAVADLNGDGAPDIVTSDGDTSLVSVLLADHEQPVPALATLVDAAATASGVRIEWITGGGSLVAVERSENAGAWMPAGRIVADASGNLVFEDHDVKTGLDYAYRLGFDQSGQTVYAGYVSVRVPSGMNTLALAASPNPALGAFGVSFTLPDARPARLEIYDVSGRRILSREVGAMGAGAHVLRLDETSRLASGLYWLRLVHPQRTLVARAAIVR